VITTVAVEGGLALAADVPAGKVAFVDRDWVPAEPGAEVPALVVKAGAEEHAARMLFAVAEEAVAAVGDTRPAEVVGAGAVARLAAGLLGIEPGGAAERPAAVVEATGDPEAIASAAERLADLGTLVLAGEPLGRRVRLNLYPDVHSRGLRVVGVRPVKAGREPRGDTSAFALLPAPAEARPGTKLDAEAAWYRVA
jgi:threonine dehydrogenase-like Zn-dependent dehydrogenase